MRPLFAAILVAASVLATSALAAMSAVNSALTQNLVARPKKVVLLPPQVFVYELSASGVPARMADWEATRDDLITAATHLSDEARLKPDARPSNCPPIAWPVHPMSSRPCSAAPKRIRHRA